MRVITGYCDVVTHLFLGVGIVQDVHCLQTSHFSVRYLCVTSPVAHILVVVVVAFFSFSLVTVFD